MTVIQTQESLEKNNSTVDIEKLPSGKPALTTNFDDFNDKIDVEQYGEIKRKLNARHVNLMIIGQSIGSGLFIGLSSPLTTSGSLSLFIGFLVWACLVIYPLMQAVGEMCSYLPIKGTFLHYSARWVDPALGFACTLIYLYTSLMFVCLEATAVASLISFWTDANPAIFITCALVSYLFVNLFGVNWYGEIEFYSSILKVFLIMGLMFVSLISMCGGNPQKKTYGFQHWKEGGLMRPYLVEGATGQFLGFWNVLIFAAFACSGPDILGLCASEMKIPRKSVGIAAKRVYIRICIFYFGGIFFLNSLIASNDSNLKAAIESKAVGAAASPWVIGIKNVGVNGLDSVVNVCILASVWSCGNGFFYGATRCAYSAALGGYLPRFLSKCLPNGAPVYCAIGSVLVGLLSFLSISNSTGTVFAWFINLATTGLLCTYLCLWWCYFKFRKAYPKQTGIEFKKGEYQYFLAPRFVHPYFTYFGLFLNILVLFFNGFWVFFPGQFSIANLFTSYFAPVLYVCLFIFWKVFKKTHFRTDMEADITTGKEQIDLEEEADIAYEASRERSQNWFMVLGRKISHFCFS